MADRVIYTDPDDVDLAWVSVNVRKEDEDEVIALGFGSVFEGLVASRDRSHFCKMATSQDGLVLGVGGLMVFQNAPGYAMPWAIVTIDGLSRKRWLVRECRQWLDEWSKVWTLTNSVHDANTTAIDFIAMLGFDFIPHEVPADHPFRLFVMPRQEA